MKRFKYSLENVLHYKEQILDSIKAEHGTLLAQIRKKEAEIQELENKLVSAQNKMDDLKKQDVQIKIFVFMVCISVKWKIRSGKNRNS